MKKQKLTLMAFVLGAVISCCNPKNEEMEKNADPVKIEIAHHDSLRTIHYIWVTAKNWKRKTAFERYVTIPLPAISEDVINKGDVLIYLKEGEKYLELPFNYYQVKRILSFEPSYKQGYAYITVFGNFIVNVSATYRFKIIVLSKRNKKTDIIA